MGRSADEVPEYSAGHVQDLLARDPRAGELELDVEVTDQTAVITGVVHTEERRQAVTTVVREALPGMWTTASRWRTPRPARRWSGCNDPDRRRR
jgi:hypothetical protein